VSHLRPPRPRPAHRCHYPCPPGSAADLRVGDDLVRRFQHGCHAFQDAEHSIHLGVARTVTGSGLDQDGTIEWRTFRVAQLQQEADERINKEQAKVQDLQAQAATWREAVKQSEQRALAAAAKATEAEDRARLADSRAQAAMTRALAAADAARFADASVRRAEDRAKQVEQRAMTFEARSKLFETRAAIGCVH